MTKNWMRRIKVLNKSRADLLSATVKGLLPSAVSLTSLHHSIEKRPTPMPLHCCTGMTMDEWAESNIKIMTRAFIVMKG